MPLFCGLLMACTSVKVTVKKPNFEKVLRENAFIVFPLQSLTATENETFFEDVVKPSAANKILVHHEPSMEWELKRLGVTLEDTATYQRLEDAGYGYLLFFQVNSLREADLWQYYRKNELGNRGDTSVPYIEPEDATVLGIILRLYSIKNKQVIYESIVRANRYSTNVVDNKGGAHVVNTGSLSTLHRKAIIKALTAMYEDCGL